VIDYRHVSAAALRRAGRGGGKEFWWVIQLLRDEYGRDEYGRDEYGRDEYERDEYERGGGAGSATPVAW